MSKRLRYSEGRSHSEKKLKIEMESEGRMSNRNPSYQKYSKERGNRGPSLKETGNRGPGLLGLAPPGYEPFTSRGKQSPSSSFLPVTTPFRSSPSSSFVPVTTPFKSSPSSSFVPVTTRIKSSPSSSFVPVTTRIKSSPSSTFVPVTTRIKSSPSSAIVTSTTQIKPFPSTTFVPVQSQNNNLSWGFASKSVECRDKDNLFKAGDAGFEDEVPWESQMRELKEYIVKLEDDKRQLSGRVEELQDQIKKDAEMISSAKKIIEQVKRAQECEKNNLDSMKISVENEKLAIDKEKETIFKERQALKLDRQEKDKLDLEVINLRNEIEELNKEKAEAIRTEEKKHLAFEVEELELRRDLTRKAIEKELDLEKFKQKIEDLSKQNCNLQKQINEKDSQNEREVSNLKAELEMQRLRHNSEKEALKRKFDSEYEIFSRVKDNFDENMKISCVFCPAGNVQTISNYLFHIAREHMFDQYKAVDVKEGSAKVGMLLKILEEKAKREFMNEISRLNKYIDSLKGSARNVCELKNEEEFSKDLESLLEVESNQKQQIEDLRNTNNILQVQVDKFKKSEKRDQQNEMVMKGITDTENGILKRRVAIANLKISEYLQSINMLNDKIDTLQKSKLKVEMENIKLKEELSNIMGDNNCLNRKLRTLEDEKDELTGAKICLESEKAKLIAQNEEKNRFKTENEALQLRLSSYEAENIQVKTELAKMKEVGKLQENDIHILQKDNKHWRQELEEAKDKNSILQSRLGEAIERIELFEKEMSECLKNQKPESDSFLDIGVESFLQAPLEDMNITKLDDIDSDELDQLESPRRKKQEQLKESFEEVGDKQLKKNVKGVADNTNFDENMCLVTCDTERATSSTTRLGDLVEINTSNEHGDLIEIDASNNKSNDDGNLKVKEVTVGNTEEMEIDASNNKSNDNGNLKVKKVIVGDTEEMEMPSNVEGQSKQKASLDNMKVKIFNCGKDEHIKEKVKALMNDMKEVSSKQNDSEIDNLPKPSKSVTLDSTEKQIESKLPKSGSKRKSKVKSYSEETSDESDHSEVEESFKKPGKNQIPQKAKNGNHTSKTSDNKEKKKRFKRNKKTSSEEMINQPINKTAKPTGSNTLNKTAKPTGSNTVDKTAKPTGSNTLNKTAKPTGSNAIDKTISCYKCGIKCKTKTELRNHILTHFYPDLFVLLPASKPFTCPKCSALNRDKTSLARHYAFTHKEIYKYCTEEQLTGETGKGKRRSVYCDRSSSKLGSVEGAKSNGLSQSTEGESWLSSASKNFNMAGDDSDDGSFGDRFNESETDSKKKSVSNGGQELAYQASQEGSDPPENISEKFLGMDDNGPADVDDLLQESDDGSD